MTTSPASFLPLASASNNLNANTALERPDFTLPAPRDPVTGDPRSVCPVCVAAMSSPSSLDRHMTKHHHPKRTKRVKRAVANSKVVRALYWPFKPRYRYGVA
ncbi:hypothetical protein JCM8097_009563 [Rhodosporidiobolus ruineniae]